MMSSKTFTVLLFLMDNNFLYTFDVSFIYLKPVLRVKKNAKHICELFQQILATKFRCLSGDCKKKQCKETVLFLSNEYFHTFFSVLFFVYIFVLKH